MRGLTLAVMALALGAPMGSQMRPDAPIVNFRLPVFGEDGWKTYELRGASGVYVNDNRIDVEEMELLLFTGGEDLFLETLITSPLATLFPQDNAARGGGGLEIRSATYQITGEDWSWDGQTDTIEVRENARVVYRAAIGNLLR